MTDNREIPDAYEDEREAREQAMNEAWGFRAETRSLSEKWSAQHWFNSGWDAHARRTVQGEPSAPDGWFPFGSHAPYPWVGLMEFSDEKDDAGMPRWEHPVQAHTPTEECNCAPGPDGVVIHNSWAHEQAHTPTDERYPLELEMRNPHEDNR